MHVLITRINLNKTFGLVELWINLDDEKKHIYDQMKEDIQIPKRKFNGSEGQPGDLCLVLFRDTWNRARIVSIQGDTFNVFLIDHGQPHFATCEDLAWAHNDSVLIPPEIEFCVLANIVCPDNNWPEGAAKFLKSLSGKKVQGVVQHVLADRKILLDVPFVSKFICQLGIPQNITGDDFKCLVLKCLNLPIEEASEIYHSTQKENGDDNQSMEKHDNYFYPALLTGVSENITVTEVTGPQNIFCQLLIFTKEVKMLSEQIHQYYEDPSNISEVQQKTVGYPCAARDKNGRWHRSLLKRKIEASDTAFEVLHVDEGRTEEVGVGRIRALHRNFLRLPVFTYQCSLVGLMDNDTGWTTDHTNHLKSLLMNKTLVAKFDRHYTPQNVYDVKLYAENSPCILEKDIINTLIHSLPTSPKDDQCIHINGKDSHDKVLLGYKKVDVSREANVSVGDCLKQQEKLLPNSFQDGCNSESFTIGASVNVKVSCIETPKMFWCQSVDKMDSLRCLMQDLQSHYASVHPGPLQGYICIARSPDNGMWYRARIIKNHHSPLVAVRFIDYGHTQMVPLQDVRPIDPYFLQLNAQAFQCCLSSVESFSNLDDVAWSEEAFTEFKRFVDSNVSSNTAIKCIIKDVTLDSEGLQLNVVDIESLPEGAYKILVQECAQSETLLQHTLELKLGAYNYSSHNLEVGAIEKIFITSSQSVHNFYCQLDRNLHLLETVTENIKQLISQGQYTNLPLGPNSLCFAKYPDNQWYRGKIAAMLPKPKVHFVDYGETLEVTKSNILPFPSEECLARSIAVQAIPLGLFDVPDVVPKEVDQWFSDCANNSSLTISVVSKGPQGKLLVDLFDRSLNVNEEVRKKISKMTQQKMIGLAQSNEKLFLNSNERNSVQSEECEKHQHLNVSRTVETNDLTQEAEYEETVKGSQSTLDVSIKDTENGNLMEDSQSDLQITHHFLLPCPEKNATNCTYKWPTISQLKTEEVFASCIVEPQHFWCQYNDTEDLKLLSKLAQEAGQVQQDVMVPETLGPGSPCLALFPSDAQWYRAMIMERSDNTLHVVFVDYGNESDVSISDVRPLPQGLLEIVPQAFLCSLTGFDKSKGTWDDQVYDEFYNLLVDKSLCLTAFSMEDDSKLGIPRYIVQCECENMNVNCEMQKHWRSVSKEQVMEKSSEAENSPDERQVDANRMYDVLPVKANGFAYKKPEVAINQTENVYASCIAEPNFFWCQYANTEDLKRLSKLTQKAGQTQQVPMFPKTLVPGSVCVALYFVDNLWYRAQVMDRNDNSLHVVFVDYGNESDVNIDDVRPLPQNLLDLAPQAFLCSLNGFDESKGSWDEQVYGDFYNLLVEKLLKVTVLEVQDHLALQVPQYVVEVKFENVVVTKAMRKYWKPVAKRHVTLQIPERENSPQDEQIDLCVSKGNTNVIMYKKPNICKKQRVDAVYASCIVGPKFFWCQCVQELDMLSIVVQEAGQTHQEAVFTEALPPSSPCLALFSSDQRWYRALGLQRTENVLHVVFIDYGNESDVDIENVRLLPSGLLDVAPQAFLCSLAGFDESKGSWDEEAYEDFYNLLVDKPLKVTVIDVEDHSELGVPQYAVQVECEGVIINSLMRKYWKESSEVPLKEVRRHEN